MLTVENLFDLPLQSNTGKANLDDIARDLHFQLKEDSTSFVTSTVRTDSELQLGFDIVKRVIELKIADRDAAAKASAKRERNQKIMAIIERKETEALGDASIDDLRKLLAED